MHRKAGLRVDNNQLVASQMHLSTEVRGFGCIVLLMRNARETGIKCTETTLHEKGKPLSLPDDF